ncbi:hypothetical protein PSY25_23205, partial [Shigella flexneri]|nr:hypothetical protein [Shigella flexneri]
VTIQLAVSNYFFLSFAHTCPDQSDKISRDHAMVFPPVIVVIVAVIIVVTTVFENWVRGLDTKVLARSGVVFPKLPMDVGSATQ